MKPVIIYDAIKRARISIEGKIDALPSVVNEIKSGVTDFKSSFNSWKSDWTYSRAKKLDKLDDTISSRAAESSVAGVKGTLRELVPVIKSRASQESIDSVSEKINPLAKENSLNPIKNDLSTIKSRGCMKRVQRGLVDNVVEWKEYLGRSYLKYLDISLPYSVNLSKAKESVYVAAKTSQGSGSSVGAAAYLISENKLRLFMNYYDVRDKLDRSCAVSWTVEEWY